MGTVATGCASRPAQAARCEADDRRRKFGAHRGCPGGEEGSHHRTTLARGQEGGSAFGGTPTYGPPCRGGMFGVCGPRRAAHGPCRKVRCRCSQRAGAGYKGKLASTPSYIRHDTTRKRCATLAPGGSGRYGAATINGSGPPVGPICPRWQAASISS